MQQQQQNIPNGLPPPPPQQQPFKGASTAPFNGVHSSHSSRDSSPSTRLNHIPPSQLPPGLNQSFQQLNVGGNNTPTVVRSANFGSSTPVGQHQQNQGQFPQSNPCSPVINSGQQGNLATNIQQQGLNLNSGPQSRDGHSQQGLNLNNRDGQSKQCLNLNSGSQIRDGQSQVGFNLSAGQPNVTVSQQNSVVNSNLPKTNFQQGSNLIRDGRNVIVSQQNPIVNSNQQPGILARDGQSQQNLITSNSFNSNRDGPNQQGLNLHSGVQNKDVQSQQNVNFNSVVQNQQSLNLTRDGKNVAISQQSVNLNSGVQNRDGQNATSLLHQNPPQQSQFGANLGLNVPFSGAGGVVNTPPNFLPTSNVSQIGNRGGVGNVPNSAQQYRNVPTSNMPPFSSGIPPNSQISGVNTPINYLGGNNNLQYPQRPNISYPPQSIASFPPTSQNQFSNVPLNTTPTYQVPQQQQKTNRYPNYATTTPPQNNYSVARDGFNKLWGTENYDLLQIPNILPATKVPPAKVNLGQEFLDAANCNPDIFRCTLTKIPETSSLLQKSRLPLGILIHPFKDLNHLPVIQCNVIVRCRACRTYINPYVYFVDSKRWKCNLCYRVNELPEEFQYDPVSKTYGDPSRRPEIKSSTIEYIAPAEYMLRPPQPAVYLFLLDISRLAIESGYLETFCQILTAELNNLPGDTRTQIGFLAYDSALHFFCLNENLSRPQEMILMEIDEVFLPQPENLLVNLKDRKDLVLDLLTQLPTRYSNSFDGNSALGAALQVAQKLMSSLGGRVSVFQAALPNFGPGALAPREDPNQRSSNEAQHLNPATDFYKRLALECSSQQIAVDLFIVNSQYVDVATISGISRFSGGCMYHFPLFKASRVLQNEAFERCLRRYLTRKIGFEAVMRIR